MAKIEIEDSELAKQIKDAEEKAALTARKQVEDEVAKQLEGTKAKTPAALKEMYENAEKLIHAHDVELGELRPLKVKKEETETPDKVLETMTDEERETLQKLYDENKVIQSSISSGGEKAMAEALVNLRKIKPPAKANPFAKPENKRKGVTTSELEEAMKKALLGAERKTFASGLPSNSNASSVKGEQTVSLVRGGMEQFRKKT